jgi:hypothetical protein
MDLRAARSEFLIAKPQNLICARGAAQHIFHVKSEISARKDFSSKTNFLRFFCARRSPQKERVFVCRQKPNCKVHFSVHAT